MTVVVVALYSWKSALTAAAGLVGLAVKATGFGPWFGVSA